MSPEPSAARPGAYRHWQPGTLIRRLIGGIAVAVAVVGFFLPWEVAPLLAGVAALLFVIAYLFHGLGVEVDASSLTVWFGPGWVRKTIDLASIRRTAVVENSFWMGWGMHMIPRGVIWNVSGWRSVELELRDGRFPDRVGCSRRAAAGDRRAALEKTLRCGPPPGSLPSCCSRSPCAPRSRRTSPS